MKKIIAVWLSINLLVLNVLPAVAQGFVPGKQVIKGLKGGLKVNPTLEINPNQLGRFSSNSSIVAAQRNAQLANAALQKARLPLTPQHSALLPTRAYVPQAKQILEHVNVQERDLLIRTDFVKLALSKQVGMQDLVTATNVYRESLKNADELSLLNVADIASLGIVGSAQQDAALILQIAQKSAGSALEPAITASAARALLRLGAYQEVAQLAESSALQPELWEGIRAYVNQYKLPVKIADKERQAVAVADFQKQLQQWGNLNLVAVRPDVQSTFLYMNAGKEQPLAANPLNSVVAVSRAKKAVKPAAVEKNVEKPEAQIPVTPVAEKFVVSPIQSAAKAKVEQAAAERASLLEQTKQWMARLKPKGLTSADETRFAQRAALYLTAFSIGLEIGTPIMASIKTALNLPLSLAVLVTVATYSPYLFGSFIANWLKGKVGRKGTVNAGLALMGGSFTLGATTLGLDGSFTAWNDQIAQFLGILGSLTAASTGAVFIHSAVGPVMTEISHKASELVRQKRGTYVELSRSIGMMASFAFPFIATSMLGLDWSAPFLLALPIVGASALTLNIAKLPNTKPHTKLATELKTLQSPVMEGIRKPRKAMKWKESLLNNSYVRLLREEPGVGSFITGLFIMNAVEMGINSGFLFMVPQLTNNESLKYLLGMSQFAVPFLLGRYLAGHFLKWFPKRSLSVATTLGGASALAALGLTDNLYAFTAALATSELGISTAFTLAFARTAIKPSTQDRITSLIMATAVACAVGPMALTWVAEGLMGTGIPEAGATLMALIGIPSALAAFSAGLFRRMENKTIPGLKAGAKRTLAKVKNFFKKK